MEQAYFPKKLGFVRLAIKHGTPLVPMYLFGENQLYRRVDGFEWLTRLIKKATGMTLPIVTAKWGLPQAACCPSPDGHVRYGRAVDVGEPEARAERRAPSTAFQGAPSSTASQRQRGAVRHRRGSRARAGGVDRRLERRAGTTTATQPPHPACAPHTTRREGASKNSPSHSLVKETAKWRCNRATRSGSWPCGCCLTCTDLYKC